MGPPCKGTEVGVSLGPFSRKLAWWSQEENEGAQQDVSIWLRPCGPQRPVKDIGFYSEPNGEPLQFLGGVEIRCDPTLGRVILLVSLRIHNRRGGGVTRKPGLWSTWRLRQERVRASWAGEGGSILCREGGRMWCTGDASETKAWVPGLCE